ncbi:MAG: hypothetical protein HOP19_06525 [Acidobacteria bacterium]|nr:hypothetical protein [Acidobacteriota bacterium]
MKAKKTKKNFSSFTTDEAFQELQLQALKKWKVESPSFQVSPFFAEHLRRLDSFDLTSSESAKELLIDAFCQEVLEQHPQLKIWKSATLQSDTLTGQVDYLVAPKMGYVTQPLLCVIEAKKDDFEAGQAQCLVEMKAARWKNEQAGKPIDIYGVVTNGGSWVFYKYAIDGQVYETLPYAIADQEKVLSLLSQVFAFCEANITTFQVRAKAA